MRILLVTINHHNAPVGLREKVALAGQSLDAALDRLHRQYPAAEWVVLCTCNRTEVYFARPTHQQPSLQQVVAMLAKHHDLGVDTLVKASVYHENEQAINHLFRVATGLESMVLGEAQILGQVKRAYETATARQTVGPILHSLFQQALSIGKQVRTATGIDTGRVSVGSVAADFAKQIFQRFDDKTILSIGAGQMGKLTLQHLLSLKPAHLWLTNRSFDKATALADRLQITPDQGGARDFNDLDQLLIEADIVLTNTGATQPIITTQQLRSLKRKRRSRPLFIIDLGVPRDVQPSVGDLTNVYLYNIDDLQSVVAQTHDSRSKRVQECEALLTQAVQACTSQLQHRDVGQLIRALRQQLLDLGQAEQQRTHKKLASCDPKELAKNLPRILDEHTHRLINKILHLPLSQLDHRKSDAPLGLYAGALRQLFGLPESPAPEATPPAATSATGNPGATNDPEAADSVSEPQADKHGPAVEKPTKQTTTPAPTPSPR